MSKSRSIPTAPKELPEAGATPAICVQFIDLGTQPANRDDWDDQRKCNLVFELQGMQRENGKPFLIAKKYTYSGSAKSNLMKDLKGWMGIKDANFDMDTCLGKPALVTITHSEDGQYANITNISSLAKGMKVGKARTPYQSLYLDETFDEDVFKQLTEFTQTTIAKSPEYAEIIAAKQGGKKKGKATTGKKK